MKHFLWVVCWLWLALEPSPALAQVQINEVHPNPTSGSDWIELYNQGTFPVTMEGWLVRDELSSSSTIFTFTNQVLEPLSWIVIEVSNKLNNSGDGVVLVDANGQETDRMTYNSSQQGQSWNRSLDPSSWYLAGPTPGGDNPSPPASPSPSPANSPAPTPSSSPTPSPSPTFSPTPSPLPSPILNLQPSEIMACPSDGSAEWLELYNPYSFTVTLDNWQVIDASNTSKTVSTTISPFSFGLVTWTGSLLNNTGDILTLKSDVGHTLFSITLASCSSGRSWVFYNQQWQETLTPTKQASNIFTPPQTTPSPSPSPTNPPLPSIDTIKPLTTWGHLSDTLSIEPETDNTSNELLASPFPWSDLNNFSFLSSPSASISGKVLGDLMGAENDPTYDPSLITHLEQPNPPKAGVIGAIMGGLVLTASSGYYLYGSLKKVFPALA